MRSRSDLVSRWLPWGGWALAALLAVAMAVVLARSLQADQDSAALRHQLTDAKERIEAMAGEAQAAQGEIDVLETQLADSQGEIEDLRDEVQQLTPQGPNSTFGDGTYEVGTDIPPGEYKTSGAKDCYWAKLRSNNSIIDNNFSSGPQVVSLERGILFESQDCGTWVLSS